MSEIGGNSTGRKPIAIWGGKAIGAAINKPPRATYWLLENGVLRAKKIGRQWQTTDIKIENFLSDDRGDV